MKKKDEGLVTLRISGRSKLSEKAAEVYENSHNKSAFLAEAIEFYVSHGMSIEEQLKELNAKIDKLSSLKGVMLEVPSESVESTVPAEEPVIETQETEEERIQRENIENTLSNFMNFGFSKGGE